MGDFADDALNAAFDQQLYDFEESSETGYWEYPCITRPTHQQRLTRSESGLARLRSKLKSTGETNAFLRIRPRIDD